MVRKRVLAFVILVMLTTQAFSITLKIASVAPENSPWGTALKRIAAEWDEVSNGKIKLKIYHNGIAGNEASMERLIRIGQLHGGVFSSYGIFLISKEILSLSIPFLIQNERELEYIMRELRPVLDGKIADAGFVNVGWSKAGWIRFFTNEKVISPDDMKKLVLATSPDDAELEQTLKLIGFDTATVPLPDVMSSLNTGLIDAIYASPIATGGYQWFGIANHMTEMKIAPFLGAIILSDRAWSTISRAFPDVDELTAIVDAVVADLDTEILNLEQDAIRIMSENGLIVHDVPDGARAEWVDAFKEATERLLGTTFSEEMVGMIEEKLREIRN